MSIPNTSRFTSVFLAAVVALGLAACGGGSDAPEAVFAAPTVSFTASQNTYDLSNYTQTGRYSLPVGTGANVLAEEASAVTYDKDTGTLFVVGDGGTSVTQVTKQGVLVDSMTLAVDASKPQGGYFYDTEGITYLGSGKFALVEERYRQVNQFTYTPNTSLGGAMVQMVKLGTTIGNIGIEGISYDPMTGGFVAVKESGPSGVFQTTIDFAAGMASNGSATTENSTNLFDPANTGMSALNDVFALSNIVTSTAADYGHIMILSAPDGKVVKMDRAGNIHSTLVVGSAAQNEGMTMDTDGNIYVVSEIGGGLGHPEMLVFSPTVNKASVGVGSNVYLNFGQTVTAGSGNITLSNGAGDTRTIAIGDATQVMINGSTVTINPASDLVAGTTYTVTYPAGLLKTADGKASPASSASSTISFTTANYTDMAAPIISTTSPADNSTDVSIGGSIVLSFNEQVVAAAGDIVISNGAGDTRTIAIGDTTQVTFSSNNVSVNPTADLLESTSYYVQVSSGAIKDLSGNSFAGITLTTTFDFTTGLAPAVVAPSLLISEVNSNATGGDFFELYNDGATTVDLTGWKWDDDSANSADAAAVTFPGVSIAAGQRLVVVAAADAAAFNAAWGNPSGQIVALGGPGLGKGDAVVLFNASGQVMAAFNYKGSDITASDGTVIATATASAGVTFVPVAHAGLAYGGSATTSAVWDGISTSTPTYKAAVVDVNGGVAQVGDSTAIGSPGVVVTAPPLLITEVNSNAAGGDFFEVYNYGTTTVDLTGWHWDDDSAKSADPAAVTFPSVSIAAGQRLVVVAAADAVGFSAVDTFNTAWSNPGGQIVALGGPGLGGGDAVVLFDAAGRVVTAFNYKGSDITASDGTVIATAAASAGVTFVAGHAGLAYGGSAKTSAVWDGVSTSTPTYKAAVVGVNGGVAQVGDATAIGSPGQ